MITNVTKSYYDLEEGQKGLLMYDECMKIMLGRNDRLEPLTLLLACILEVRYEVLEDNIEVIPNTISDKE